MNDEITIEKLEDIFTKQKASFVEEPFRSYKQRIRDLKALKKMLLDNQDLIVRAISEDFGHRCEDDSRIADILTTVSGINYSIKKLKSWMRPVHKHISILFQPGSGKVIYQPLGVVGIMTPWNYPVFLALGPLTAALAAGNNAMIKMSEYTPRTTELLDKLMSGIFDKSKVAVVGGEVEISSAFSSLQFDHLFFTGSTQVGRLVMKATAENLVPVTLELGGKSPAIIDDEMDIKTAVSRFILGKTLNSGQTCVAPDYVFVPEDKIEELVKEMRAAYSRMFPTVCDNSDCTSIINQAQYSRLNGLLQDAEEKGATVIPLLDDKNDTERKMPLTVVIDTNDVMTLMQQEIFGPILPIMGYKDIQEVTQYINARPRPLSLYIFSFNHEFQKHILQNTHAGGVCVNEATFHVACDDLPFGGVGASGTGQYHGDEGFKTFSHAKSIFSRGRLTLAHLLFPPYGKMIHKLVYKLFIR